MDQRDRDPHADADADALIAQLAALRGIDLAVLRAQVDAPPPPPPS